MLIIFYYLRHWHEQRRTCHCMNGGTCKKADFPYLNDICVCPLGYTGRFCDISPCKLQKCLNGGQLSLLWKFGYQFYQYFRKFFLSLGKCATIRTNGIGTFECKCKVGYFGRLCESKKATEFILNDTFVNTPFTSELALAKNALHFSGAWPRFVFFSNDLPVILPENVINEVWNSILIVQRFQELEWHALENFNKRSILWKYSCSLWQ